jgi:hypothetical protein
MGTKMKEQGKKRAAPPAIPDLRFEQSYRRAIAPAGGSVLWIALITLRDQVIFPFVQGFGWAFILIGFRTWRQGVAQNGSVWGSK